MVLLLSLPIGIALGLASGGTMSGLARLRLRGESGLLALLATQAIFPLMAGVVPGGRWVYYLWATSIPVLVCLLLLNWRKPGLVLAAAGVAMNGCVILANGGMPVDIALTGVGARISGSDFAHVALGAETSLSALADVVPLGFGRTLWGLASAGDFVLAGGVAVVVAWSCVALGPRSRSEAG